MTQCPHIVGLSTCSICDAERIAELEAENRRLRGQSDTAKHIQKVAELEAENAKLREKADYSYEDTTRLAELRALAQAVVDNTSMEGPYYIVAGRDIKALAAAIGGG